MKHEENNNNRNIRGFLIPREDYGYAHSVLAFMRLGYGNGYCILPKGHIWHGKSYDYINQFISVHGGLTFSDYISSSTGEVFNAIWDKAIRENNIKIDDWIIGFDTAHSYSSDMNVSGLCDGGASRYKCSINYKSQINAEKFKYSTNAPLLQNPC